MSKGSKRRPTDEGKYRDGWERIFMSKDTDSSLEAALQEMVKRIAKPGKPPSLLTWTCRVCGRNNAVVNDRLDTCEHGTDPL